MQVAILLRVLFESCDDIMCGCILESSATLTLPTAIASTLTLTVFHSSVTMYVLQRYYHHFFNVCMYVCINCMYVCERHPSTMEGVIPMVDLMLAVLHFVIRAVSESSAPGFSQEEKEGATTAAQVRFPTIA